MYAGCPRYYDEVGRGNLTPEQEREVLDKLPPFDPETARSARDRGASSSCSAHHPAFASTGMWRALSCGESRGLP